MKIIDIHTHGIGGFDTRTASEEHILKIAEIQGSLGVSGIVPTVYPSTIDAMRENMHAIKKALAKQTCAGVTSQIPEAKIIGIHLEGPFLNPSKCGALGPASFIKATEYNLNKLIDGFEDVIKIITIAPEMEGAIDIIKATSRKGIIASMGHSDSSYAEAEAGFRAGARCVTHIFNAMRGLHHREPGLAGFGLMNSDIYIEVIADPFHLDRRIMEFIFSVKNTDKIIIISDSVQATNTVRPPHRIRNEDDILLGGSLTIKEAAEQLIREGLDQAIVIKSLSENPREYLQLGFIQ
ncbi:MAG: hypothetical protein HZC49_10485 [Nitrospirae bacterium]|nr:hypothetical protein [Nitrospirota bacterium]